MLTVKHNYRYSVSKYMHFYTPTFFSLFRTEPEWSKYWSRGKAGKQRSSVGGCSGLWGEGWGWGVDGQDRLYSLPPVCYGWIGDYSSRCVIRSKLYSWDAGWGGGLTREHWGGHAWQKSRFSGVKWICGMCQVVFLRSHSPSNFPLSWSPQLSFHGFPGQEVAWNKHK